VRSLCFAGDATATLFTDLDGTLLDHHDYGFAAARPALRRLAECAVPLVLASSKTLAETAWLNRELDNAEPLIVENGAAVCLPLALAPLVDRADGERQGDYLLWRLAPDYRDMVALLNELRATLDVRVRGFSDMSVDEVVRRTGLEPAAAARAKQRLSAEPLLWQDDERALARFAEAVAERELQLVRGGRFWHLMGRHSKASAATLLLDLWRRRGGRPGKVVALGDSDNDRELLELADLAVLVRRVDGQYLACRRDGPTWRTDQPGPKGWNDAVLRLLEQWPLLPV
jgi:mannosyl-3-phosphoglycerate phosphatase